jgi:hypothetical protein
MTGVYVALAAVCIFVVLPLVCFICAKTITLGYLKASRDFFNKE